MPVWSPEPSGQRVTLRPDSGMLEITPSDRNSWSPVLQAMYRVRHTTLQLHELRRAIGSPVGRSEEYEHEPLRVRRADLAAHPRRDAATDRAGQADPERVHRIV